MNETYLVHHGILGQKWGKKNGPPYPLDFSKLSAEERKQAKKESIDKGDVETASAYKNRNYYSNQELNELINRFDLNSRLQQKVSDIDKAKAEKGMKAINKMLKAADLAITIGSKAGKGFETYNKIKSELDKAMGNDSGTKSTFSYNAKKLADMMKNPDKYSDQEWANVKNRMQTINNVETTRKMMSDRAKEAKVDADIEKTIKDIAKQNKKDSKKNRKVNKNVQDVVNIINSYSEDPNVSGWDFVDRKKTLRIGMK